MTPCADLATTSGMNRRSFLTSAVRTGVVGVGFALGGTLGSARRVRAAQGPIRIGFLSRAFPPAIPTVNDSPHARGFLLAVDELNARGGVLGRPVEVTLGDYTSDPKNVAAWATRLLQEEKVDLLAGTATSAERNAVGPIVSSADKLLLYGSYYEGQDQEHFPGVCNKLIFMFGPEPSQQFVPHLDYIMQRHGRVFYGLGADYVWPRVVLRRLRAALETRGGRLVAEEYFPVGGEKDFAPVLERIRSSGATVVFGALIPPDNVTFARQFYQAGMDQKLAYWGAADHEATTRAKGPQASAGSYSSFDYFMALQTPENQAFLKRLRAKHGPDALMYTAGVAMYNAAHMFARAAEQAGSLDTDKLVSALEGIRSRGPQGEVYMRAKDHQIVVPSYLARARKEWKGFEDMFDIVRSTGLVEPTEANCTFPLKKK